MRHRPHHESGCCQPTNVGHFVDGELVDVQIHHHCGRYREHMRPADWRAGR